MGLEAPDYNAIGTKIYDQVRDGALTSGERKNILSCHEEECFQMQSETRNNLQELHAAMDIFEASLDMKRADIRILQRIL